MMSAEQRKRCDALPYGDAFTPDEALDALEAEVATRRQTDPVWRFSAQFEMSTLWHSKWPAGSWVSTRRGDRAQAKLLCDALTEEQLRRLDDLPYGLDATTDQKLGALEREVARRQA